MAFLFRMLDEAYSTQKTIICMHVSDSTLGQRSEMLTPYTPARSDHNRLLRGVDT